MKVSEEYAVAHFSELITAAQNGELVEITFPGKPDIQLIISEPHATVRKVRRGVGGSGNDKIWMADDFNSDETNAEIARLFNDGPIDPHEG